MSRADVADRPMAWLVLAHVAPDQLHALLEMLVPAGGSDFAVVHLDRKSRLWRETQGRFLADLPNVTVIANPVTVHWAHASQVTAVRLVLAEALRRPFHHAHLISGVDWPLVGRSRILADLASADGRDCQIEALPGEQAWRMERISLHARWLRPDPGNALAVRREWLLRRLSARLPTRSAKPWGPWHKGSTWWSLPRDVCERINTELAGPAARRVLRFTQCADEHAIQTIVARHYPDRVADPRRYISWTGDWSPRVLTAADWPAARTSGAWLARKVSADVDPFFLAEAWPT